MPEIDGYEAIKLIKSGKKNKEGDKLRILQNIRLSLLLHSPPMMMMRLSAKSKSVTCKVILEILDKAIS